MLATRPDFAFGCGLVPATGAREAPMHSSALCFISCHCLQHTLDDIIVGSCWESTLQKRAQPLKAKCHILCIFFLNVTIFLYVTTMKVIDISYL